MKQTKSKTLVLMMACLLAIACNKGGETSKAFAEEQIENAQKAKNYNQLLELADSFQQSGDLSPAKAYYWLGYASDRLKKLRMAEFYWKASLEAASQTTNAEDMDMYAKSASRLANLLMVRGDYEGALKGAIPAATRLEEQQCDSTSDYVNLLIYIGCCQAGLGKKIDSTTDGFDRAYRKHLENIQKTHSDEAYKNAIAGLINIAYACNTIKDYAHAQKWIGRFGELLSEYEQRPDANPSYVDKQVARFNIYKAVALVGLEQPEEAAKVYEEFKTKDYSQTPEGRIIANDYLRAAGRWAEAADNYQSLDAVLENKNAISLDDVDELLLKKYQANQIAGRKDSAIAVSLQICNALEQAFEQAQQSDKEEQSTIVANVEKLTERQAEAEKQSRMSWNILLAALFLCFIVYVFYRRKVSRELKDAHDELQEAYENLEADTAAKERLATEQRIAQSIKNTIAEPLLPRRKDLALNFAVIPGTLEGSNFCDCYVQDGLLFICVGDTENEGVEASMLATMTKAQFRTASAYEKQPKQILTAILQTVGNMEELSIKLFVGVLDLATGHLTYANANQNAPIIMDGELKKLDLAKQETDIQPGTLLFFYTDMFIQAENKERKKYGEKRLLGTALQAMKMDPTPQPFVNSMIEGVKTFTEGKHQQSDISVCAIKYAP
jgi:hypothetical protein